VHSVLVFDVEVTDLEIEKKKNLLYETRKKSSEFSLPFYTVKTLTLKRLKSVY